MEKDLYKEQKTDMVKLVLRLKRRIWIPIAALFLGALLFSAVYLLQYRIKNGPMYQAVSKVYLDFAQDDTGEVYQYYNGYTWNDLMSTDPIIGKTMETLPGIDRSVVEASTRAEILSDIRLLTVTITNPDETVCGQIQDATERSLELLGDSAKEFLDITVVKSVKPERVMVDRRIRQAALLGAVLSFAAALAWLWLRLILDDTVFVPADLLGNLKVPFLGIDIAQEGANVKNGRCLKCVEQFRSDLQSNKALLCPEPDRAVSLDVCELMGGEAALPDYEALRKAPYVILQVRFGKVSLRALHYLLQQLAVQQCEHVGVVITDADAEWMYHYFRWRSEK